MRRVLLDESLPRPLLRVLTDLDIVTVQEAGWAGLGNGALLEAAHKTYDVLLTADKNLRFQQNVDRFSIGIVVTAGRSTKLEDLLPLVPLIRAAIEEVGPGQVVEVDGD